ncbi:MAG: F0F1 ATP synthase subunit A [Deltaproteobacteria bacterium]|nr:F0F1 ATP synthase subunit A [Deltaproteobacteria bacterium]
MDHSIWLPTFGLPVHTALMLYVCVGLIIFSLILSSMLKVVPGKCQVVVELMLDGLKALGLETMGPKGAIFIPACLTFFVFILISNALGMIPGLLPPTAVLNTTVGMALLVFITTHVVGFKAHGFSYYKHFIGPIKLIAPFMFVLELFGHIVRPVSLSFRLFGNMFGHEQLIMVLLMLMPFMAPMLIFSTVLGVLSVVLQAFIFTLLTMAYIGGALEEAH